VETAERFADDTADELELAAVYEAAFDVGAVLARRAKREEDAFRCAAWAASSAAHPDELAEDVALMVDLAAVAADMKHEGKAQADLTRCLFGNPFRRNGVNPAWLAWNDGTLRKIAQSIYDERAFDRLPILADALEDAGCDNADILAHCRSEGPHVRGCWVVDLLLGKS
jgi:hypothetical protein